jgi:hypothetical protein
MASNGNGKDIPALTLDELKRVDVAPNIFETTLNIEQCRRILRATERHDANFRKVAKSNDPKLRVLVEAMKKDRWVWTDADPIRLHLLNGEIVCSDGQHRLTAALEARRVLHTLVMWGDDWIAGVHVDRNRGRNVSQYLAHDHGVKSTTLIVAAARLHLARCYGYENGQTANYSRVMLEDEDVIEFVLKHHDALLWASGRGGVAGGRGFSTTGYHVMLFELSTIRQEIAEQFHNDLIDPNLDATDALNQLRRAMARRYGDTGLRATANFTLGNMVKAHNMRSVGEHPLKWVMVRTDDITFPAGFTVNGQRVKASS